MIGATIGTYRILSTLGQGGMGTVYVAEHTLLGRRAAIKVLLPEMSVNQSIVNRFFNEARAVTSISDPGIVQVFDFGFHTDGSAFIVMELLIGETVGQRLLRIKRIKPLDALRICRQVSGSLAAAHARGVIHRDLKPDNIFIVGDPAMTGGERAKILDFGIAKLSVDPGKEATRTGILMGTPVYMSPEQCRGAGDIDARSDIYALGCVLFRMILGRPPFDGLGSGEIIASHLKDPPPSMKSFAPEIDPRIDALVARCLSKSPDDRPQSATELADLLGTAETGQTYNTPVPRRSAPLMAADLPEHLTPISPSRSGAATEIDVPDGGYTVNISTPTTLQSAVGQTSPSHVAVPKSRRGLVIGGLAALAVAAGVIMMSGITGGGDGEKREVSPAQPGDTRPVASQPAEPKPAEPKPVEPKPADPVEPKPVDTAAAAIAPTDATVAETLPIATTTKPIKPKKKPRPTKPGAGSGSATPRPTGPIDRGD